MAELVARLDEKLALAAANTGFPLDQVRYVLCMLLMIFAAIPFRLLPGAALKHIFSIVLSVSACIFCLGMWSWLHSFGTALVVYILMAAFPRVCHILSFVFCFGYISGSHIYRQYTDYMGWSMDFTGPQMVLTLKLVSIAFCYHDGLPGMKIERESQQKKALKSLPSILEYFGYVYFYPSFLAGPTLDFHEYRDYLSGAQFDDKYCKGRIPSTVIPTVKWFIKAILCMAFLVVVGGHFPNSDLVSPHFSKFSLTYRAQLIALGPTLARFKYYFGWYLAGAAFVACGVAYKGYGVEWEEADRADGQAVTGSPGTRWDRFANVRIEKVELGLNVRDITVYWNYRTGQFLREYVYERIPAVTNRGIVGLFLRVIMNPTLDVFLVSAFWHGFYPGYYMFFVFLSVQVTLAREARRMFRWHFLQPAPLKVLYDFLTFAVTGFFTGYSGIAFLLMSWKNIVRWYGEVHWYGHWALLAAIICVKVGAKILPREPKKDAPVKKQ